MAILPAGLCFSICSATEGWLQRMGEQALPEMEGQASGGAQRTCMPSAAPSSTVNRKTPLAAMGSR